MKDNVGIYYYYDPILKKCWDSYPSGYYIKDSTSTPYVEVVEECEKFYYQGTPDATKFYCVDQCFPLLFFFNFNKK